MKYLNGINLEEKYGLIITNGTNVMLAMPERKDSLTTDFKSQNGIIKDLEDPKFKARVFPFDCVMKADTVDELIANYWAFFSLLKRNGKYTFFDDFINTMLYLFYQKQSNLGDMYSTDEGGYAMKFTIEFDETDPFDNIPLVFLVDGNYNVLVP